MTEYIIDPKGINVYDQVEIYEDCTVQILTNTITGEQSIGWWRNDKPPITNIFNENEGE